jgi:cytochrome c553
LVASLAAMTAVASGTEDESLRAEADERVAAILELSPDPAYGAYLAGDCATCHRASGGSDGIPPIAGLPADYTVNALIEYKLGIRENEVMVVRVARLGDAEIAALAAHFADQKP